MNTTTAMNAAATRANGAPRAPEFSPLTSSAYGGYGSSYRNDSWLIQQRNAGATPAEISALLIEAGWSADEAAAASLRSLRRADRHRLMYITQCWSAGLAVLGAGSTLHAALSDTASPYVLAGTITLMMVAAPIAVITQVILRTTEATEPHAMWSPTRRTLFGTLLGCTVLFGLVRLLRYTYELIAAAVGLPGHTFNSQSFAQVLVTLALALPLGWWSHREWKRSSVAHRSLGTTVTPTTEDSQEVTN